MNNSYPVPWPYLEAKNYSDWDSIFQTFPHLSTVNPSEHPHSHNILGMVIRSANDDNVHKVHLPPLRPSSTASGPPPPKIKTKYSSSGNANSTTIPIPTSSSVQSKVVCSKVWPG